MNRRGQAEIKVLIWTLEGAAGVALAQAVGDSVHVIPDAMWHAGTWVVAVLVGVVAFFGRRLLLEVERDLERERQQRERHDARINALEREVHAISVVCRLQHPHSPIQQRQDRED